MALKKPTPTQAVLLMSAAGLGLSLPGVALASRDLAPTGPALSFGVPARSEQPCSSRDLGTLASCPGLAGELLQTFVAEAMALPLPLAAVQGPAGLELSFRASDAYATRPTAWPHEARTGHDGPQPGDDAPRPELAAAAQVAEGSNREAGHEDLVMVLPEHPPGAAGGTAASAALPGRSESTQRQTRVRAAAEAPHEPDRAALALAVPATQWAAPEGDASSALTEARSPDAVAVQAADRGTGRSQVGTAESQPPSASVESVWASLAEVLGSRLDESAPATEASHAPAAPRPSVTVASRAPAPDVSAPPANPPGGHSDLLWRSSEADDIVVAASHSDKVLLDLAALRSGVGAHTGSCGAHASKTIVLRHSDKVLQTLALFQPRKPSRAAFGCSQEPQDRAQAVAPEAAAQTRDGVEPAASSASASLTHEVDILLDLSPPAAHRSAQPLAQAEPAPAAPPEAPSADRANRRAIGSDMVAVSSQRLDEVRGGFVTETGLKVSFGIERAVYLNGSLVTTTSLNISDLSKIAGGQAQVTGAGSGSLALVQSGSGNAFSPGSISSTAAGTVIQNTLDNQKINTVTRIDAVVNSAGIMRSINLQSSMRSAIVDSLRR